MKAANRQLWDFHGGIHPQENKHQSTGQPITFAGIPEQLVFPLSQHIGAPAKPVVAVGDKVLKGQVLAEAAGFVSVPLHASTSGTVIAIEPRVIPHASGMSAPCIVLQSDGEDRWIEHRGIDDYQAQDKAALLQVIRNAGIAGMGGAGFPSAVKLATDKTIETLILNGTECEPYITADDMLMRERAEQIIEGALILQHLIAPTKETLIGIEDNKPEAIAALRIAAADTDIEIAVFPTKYPSGGEKQLIEILTGKQVPSGGLPADIGVVCQNVGTTVAVHDAVTRGRPLISRITTVTGDACQQQRNFEVLLGSPVSFLLRQCGYQPNDNQRLVMGGPMMGFALKDDSVPVVKTTNCLLAPTAGELPAPTPAQACIRCGLCAEACPVSLLPQQLYWFARSKEYSKLEEHLLMDCIECGACSYACPSNIPLVQYYRASKAAIREQHDSAVKAEQSKARFEARQERIERQEAEKEAKRKARKAAAAKRAQEQLANKEKGESTADTKADIIAAAVARTKAKKAGKAPEPAGTGDAAQDAIARAQQKRAEQKELTPEQKLQQSVSSLQQRIEKARGKLATAEAEGADTVDVLRDSIGKLEAKLKDAQQQLADSQPAAAEADAAQLAIERARQKRAEQKELTPEQKLQQSIASLQQRIDKARAKLAAAEAEGADTVDVLRDSIGKLEGKLNEARQQLAELNPPATEQTPDPAKAAIERAQQKRAEQASLSPTEKLQQSVASLEQRLTKVQQKLAEAEASGDDTAETLRQSAAKLQSKLNDARQQLAQVD